MSTVTGDEATPRGQTSPWMRRVYDRKLDVYPDTQRRSMYLAVTVLATIVLYYELFVQGAVSTKIIQHFGFTLHRVRVRTGDRERCRRVRVARGGARRPGRAARTWSWSGQLVTGAADPVRAAGRIKPGRVHRLLLAARRWSRGSCLVATPALIRDFSPQVRRGDRDGVLDDGAGAGQPGRDRGLQPHAGQPPGLAVPVPAVRHRRAGRVGDHAVGCCGSSRRSCAIS